MTITTDTIIRQNPDQISTEMDGETVMMNVDSGRYFGLNAVASDIWAQITEPKPVRDVIADLQRRYEVDPVTCEADVLALVADLVERNLVEVS